MGDEETAGSAPGGYDVFAAGTELDEEVELELDVDDELEDEELSFLAGALLSDLLSDGLLGESLLSLGLRSRLGFDRFESDFESLL